VAQQAKSAVANSARARVTVKRCFWAPGFTPLLFLLLTIASLSRECHTQQPGPSQTDVQAVYLFDFAKFVRWPPGTEREPLTICVDAQRAYLDTLTRIVAGERIETRPLAIRAIQDAGDVAGCYILFVDASAKKQLNNLLAATAGKPVVTVSDVPGFLDRGGMIQFLVISNHVRFSVNLRPVERSGISLSSELLKVAVSVDGQASGGRAR
jgi:hypothetical protein